MESGRPQQRSSSGNSLTERLTELLRKRNYELLGELGRGGMGIVYLAKDIKLDRKVALKTLSPDRASRENSMRRFEREARTFAQIRHPNIAMLYEFCDEEPLQYLALEYIDGYDLESERRRGKRWDPVEGARIIATVAQALDHTHAKGILHRDIKPGNILIERATNRVVLTDFGLAKGRKDEALTAVGFAVGTPAYMAPEQISDQFGVKPDGRSDIFSLGTVFYEMLTGKHPFLGQDDLKTMRAIVQQPAPPLRTSVPGIPESLETIVGRMLEKHPDDRYPYARDAAEALEGWIQAQKGDKGSSAARPAPKSAAATAPLDPARPADKAPAKPAAAPPPAAPAPAASNTFPIIIIVVIVALVMLALGVGIGLLLRQ